MRILIAYEGFYRSSGGVETHLREIIRTCPHALGILTDRFPPGISYRDWMEPSRGVLLEVGPLNVSTDPNHHLKASPMCFPLRLIDDYRRLSSKAKTVRGGDWDLYHFHGFNLGSDVLRACRLLSMTDVAPRWLLEAAPRNRRLLTVHGLNSELTNDAHTLALEKRMLSCFRYIVCVDRHLVESVERIGRQIPCEFDIHYVPNSIDTHVFRYRTPRKNGPLRLGFVGRAEKSRGISFLNEIARKLPIHVELHLALAASGRDLSRVPASLLERANRALINVPPEKMPAFYDSVDVVINPVLAKGISRTTLEAMSVGRPVIMLARGDRYPVMNDRTGFVVRNSREALERIEGFATNRDLLVPMSTRAREVVEREFDSGYLLPALYRIYQDIVGKG